MGRGRCPPASLPVPLRCRCSAHHRGLPGGCSAFLFSLRPFSRDPRLRTAHWDGVDGMTSFVLSCCSRAARQRDNRRQPTSVWRATDGYRTAIEGDGYPMALGTVLNGRRTALALQKCASFFFFSFLPKAAPLRLRKRVAPQCSSECVSGHGRVFSSSRPNKSCSLIYGRALCSRALFGWAVQCDCPVPVCTASCRGMSLFCAL